MTTLAQRWAIAHNMTEDDAKFYLAFCSGDEKLMACAAVLADQGISRDFIHAWIVTTQALLGTPELEALVCGTPEP